MKTQPKRGSHLPPLMRCVAATDGPILELGCGMYSTPYLHWACLPTQRTLVTVEGNPEWFEWAKGFQTPWHEVICTDRWADVDLSARWAVALVDHEPAGQRLTDILRLTHAHYVIAHDAERANAHKYRYDLAYPLFQYRQKYVAGKGMPSTAIFSNAHDLAVLDGLPGLEPL